MRIARTLCMGLAVFTSGGQQTALPLWLDGVNHPNERALDALAIIGAAGAHGLDPGFYAPSREAMAGGVRFENELTLGMTRYLEDLHRGRVDPRALGLIVEKRTDTLDVAHALHQAVEAGRLSGLVSEVAPQSTQYRSLQASLATYRALARNASLPALPAVSTAVHPGDSFNGAAALHARLAAFGDVAPETPPPAEATLTAPLVEGLKRFQTRHGLTSDGILGKRTVTALQVSAASRVRQIELALERLRWLPRALQDRVIVVNIPMFRLWALEGDSSGAAPLTMKVIVGRAIRTRTPIFIADLKAVIFRPYWNVPLSIARGEIVPKIRRDPGYLVRNRLEIVRGDGDDAAVIRPTSDALDQVALGTLRIRQRPGPDNSLGLIKFDIPNAFSVYMHGTPAVQLFQEERRDFSHGCVRVEDPVALAQWVLDSPAWSRETITAATNDVNSRAVGVTRPIRVWLFYTTAVALPDGTAHFAADLYGHDVRLDRALR
jgi:murein L,D-transpeptidase YcbB/YkuD